MITMNSYTVIYKESHTIKSSNVPSSVKTITIYTSQEPVMKELVIDITDDRDPFILYKMKMCESDFTALKNNQKLTLEFTYFPEKLITLLKETKRENTRMYIYMEEERLNATLSIREESTIKHVIHLSLKFEHGTELDIKEKATKYIMHLKATLQSMEKTCSEMTELSSSLQERLQSQENEIAELKDSHRQKQNELEYKLSTEVAALEIKEKQVTSNLQKEYCEKLHAIELENKNKIDCMTKTIEALETEKNALKRDNDILKARLRETSNKIDAATVKHRQTEQDLNTVRIRIAVSREELDQKQDHIDFLTKQVEQIKSVCCSKQSQLEEALKNVRTLTEQYSEASSNLRSVNLQWKDLQEKHKNSCRDLAKAKQIITGLQKESLREQTYRTQIKRQLYAVLVNKSSLKEELKKMETKMNGYLKQLTDYKTECTANRAELQDLKLQKLNLQKALSSVYKELTELKQGNTQNGKLPSAICNTAENMDAYYYKKFTQESMKNLDGVPLPPLLEEGTKDQDPKARTTEKDAIPSENVVHRLQNISRTPISNLGAAKEQRSVTNAPEHLDSSMSHDVRGAGRASSYTRVGMQNKNALKSKS